MIIENQTSTSWIERIDDACADFERLRDLSSPQLEEVQRKLAHCVRIEPLSSRQVHKICGVDVHYAPNGQAIAAAVVLSANGLNQLTVSTARGVPGRDYDYGFLAFRELPLILAALRGLETIPDVIFYDGNGLAHPRGLGAACHLGVLLDRPVVGVSKNVAAYRPFSEQRRGKLREIDNGAGALVTTREAVKPVCVSPGHRVDLPASIELTLAMSRTRIPEPIRRADQLCRAM